jgi:hypothetical protein
MLQHIIICQKEECDLTDILTEDEDEDEDD